MKSGIIRRVDQLGRIVLPMELRKSMKLHEGTRLELSLDGERIVLSKYDTAKDIIRVVEGLLDILPPEYKDVVFSDNDSVIASTKSAKSYIGRSIDKVGTISYKSLLCTRDNSIFDFDKKFEYSYISSILKDGDRLGFVVLFCDKEPPESWRQFIDFLSSLISSQV